MSTEVRLRRGTALQHAAFTGAMAELTVDTTNQSVRVHDGATPGGSLLAKEADLDARATIAATRASLKALDTTRHTVASLKEAGRQGTFVWTTGDFSAQVAADTLEGIYIKATAIAATAGAWIRVYSGPVSVKWFGAKGDNAVTDDTASIQAAVTFVGFLGGGIAYIPAGKYKTTAAITVVSNHVRIVGEGAATEIKPATAGQVCFDYGNNVTILQYTGLSHVRIIPTAQIQAAVRVRYFFWFQADDVKVNTLHNVGFEIERGLVSGYLCVLRDCFTNASANYGVALGRAGADNGLANVLFFNCHFDLAGNAGVQVESVSGLIWIGGEALNCERGLVLEPGANQNVRACLFSQLFLDTADQEIVRMSVASAGRRISTISFDNLSVNASANGQGFLLSGLAADPTLLDQIRINNCEVTINEAHGLYATHCTDIDIVGTHFIANGRNLTDHGAFFDTGVSNARITGGSSNGGSSFANTQRYGVAIAAGVTGVVITGMNVAGNVTGPILDGGTGTIIRDCTGCVTFNVGSANMLAAATTVVVNHGLAFTPAVHQIGLTHLVDPGVSGAQRFWVSAATSTTFTISVNAALAAGHFFGWKAGVKGN